MSDEYLYYKRDNEHRSGLFDALIEMHTDKLNNDVIASFACLALAFTTWKNSIFDDPDLADDMIEFPVHDRLIEFIMELWIGMTALNISTHKIPRKVTRGAIDKMLALARMQYGLTDDKVVDSIQFSIAFDSTMSAISRIDHSNLQEISEFWCARLFKNQESDIEMIMALAVSIDARIQNASNAAINSYKHVSLINKMRIKFS